VASTTEDAQVWWLLAERLADEVVIVEDLQQISNTQASAFYLILIYALLWHVSATFRQLTS
jgi:succinate dehydrogenase hydrophobic anchor subunit